MKSCEEKIDWFLVGPFLMIISLLNGHSVYTRRLIFGVELGRIRQGAVAEKLISQGNVPYHLGAMGVLFSIGLIFFIYNKKNRGS